MGLIEDYVMKMRKSRFVSWENGRDRSKGFYRVRKEVRAERRRESMGLWRLATKEKKFRFMVNY